MIQSTIAIFSSLLLFRSQSTIAECPNPSDLPAMYNDTLYLGAYWYDGDAGGTSKNLIQSCLWAPRRFPDGVQFETGKGKHFVKHSLVVRPGCVVYEFANHSFTGRVKTYPTGVYPNIRDGSKGIKVRCNIERVSCKPTDEFTSVLVCDATNAQIDIDCSYNRTIGTTMEKEMTQSMSMDSKLEKDLTQSFWNRFSSTLKISNTTGYDWTQVSQLAKQQLERFEVRAVVPAGHVLKIEQVFGNCGGNQVRTEFFRMSLFGTTGVDEVRYLNETENLLSDVNYEVVGMGSIR